MKHIMIWLVRLYRKFISPILPGSCRFTPTCSAYAIEAFEKRGFFAGFILTVWRILRCNPFCKSGYDPVPEKGFRRVKLPPNQHTDPEPAKEQINIEAQNAALPEESSETTEKEQLEKECSVKDEPTSSEKKATHEDFGKDNFEA